MSTSKHTLELSSTQATECKIQFVSCPFINSHAFFTQFNLTCLQCFFQVKVANKRKFCKCLYFFESWNILMKLSFEFFLNLFSRYLKEQIKQLKEEKSMAVSALARYKVRQVEEQKTVLRNIFILLRDMICISCFLLFQLFRLEIFFLLWTVWTQEL